MSLGPVQSIPLSKIKCGIDIRDTYDAAKTAQLAATIKNAGQLSPVIVWCDGESFRLVDGHRRFAAMTLLKSETIEARVFERPPSEGEGLVRALICNLQRESLSPLATARAISELIQTTGCNASQAAAQLGLSPATVSRLLGLLTLSADLLAQIEAGRIGISMAYELSRVEDPAKQLELARKAAAGQVTRDGVNGHVQRQQPRRATGRQVGAGRVTAALGNSRNLTISAPNLTLDSFIGIVEEVLARARRVRSRGVELDTFLRMLRDEAKASPNAGSEKGGQP